MYSGRVSTERTSEMTLTLRDGTSETVKMLNIGKRINGDMIKTIQGILIFQVLRLRSTGRVYRQTSWISVLILFYSQFNHGRCLGFKNDQDSKTFLVSESP